MKIKHLFYVVLSCLVVGYAVYSWTEPTTMPSSYNTPINTSAAAQTKVGEIGASTFRDADDSSYYINPSGDSIISGKIVTETDVVDSDPFGTIATKGYVDLKAAEGISENIPAAKLYVVKDDANYSPDCPTGTVPIARHWLPTWAVWGNSCVTPEWGGPTDPPFCFWGGVYYAQNNDIVICAGPDPVDMLFALEHSKTDCTNAGGTVEIVEGGVQICKFPYTKLSGNCRDYTASGFYPYTDSCICPAGWKIYKDWSVTARPVATTYCHVDGQGVTPNILVPHDWSNIAREHCWDGETQHYAMIVDYKGCY